MSARSSVAQQVCVGAKAPNPDVGDPPFFVTSRNDTESLGFTFAFETDIERMSCAAADPAILPVGSVVRLETPNPRYSGVWTVMDTGPAVKGRSLDLYLWSCKEALDFGRRKIRLTVLRLGWSPENSIPGMVDTLFRKREAESKKPTAPAPTPPATLPSSDARFR